MTLPKVPRDLRMDWRAGLLLSKRGLRHAKRNGLWESLVGLGHALLEWLCQFSVWAVMTMLLAVAIVDSAWDNDQIDWWRD